MVTAYRTGTMEAWVLRRAIKVNSVILANLVIGDNVIPEFLQENCTARNWLRRCATYSAISRHGGSNSRLLRRLTLSCRPAISRPAFVPPISFWPDAENPAGLKQGSRTR